MKAELNPLNEDNVQSDNCWKSKSLQFTLEVSESPDTKAFILQSLEAIYTEGCDIDE